MSLNEKTLKKAQLTFRSREKLDSRDFKTWYHRDDVQRLVGKIFSPNDETLNPIVFFDGLFDQNPLGQMMQITADWLKLSGKKYQPIIFKPELAAVHYMAAILRIDTKGKPELLIFNPVGHVNRLDINSITKLGIDVISSTHQVQTSDKDGGPLVSCGPISVEFIKYALEHPEWIAALDEKFILPETLSELVKLDTDKYQEKIKAFRIQHDKLMGTIEDNQLETIEDDAAEFNRYLFQRLDIIQIIDALERKVIALKNLDIFDKDSKTITEHAATLQKLLLSKKPDFVLNLNSNDLDKIHVLILELKKQALEQNQLEQIKQITDSLEQIKENNTDYDLDWYEEYLIESDVSYVTDDEHSWGSDSQESSSDEEHLQEKDSEIENNLQKSDSKALSIDKEKPETIKDLSDKEIKTLKERSDSHLQKSSDEMAPLNILERASLSTTIQLPKQITTTHTTNFFTPSQKNADLNKRYDKLWDKTKSNSMNIRAVLADYTQDNSYFWLTVKAHLNRHHIEAVTNIIKKIDENGYYNDDDDAIVEDLYAIAKQVGFNKEGSLNRRIQFIEQERQNTLSHSYS
jgi:Domain of unknown function (DUF5617)